MIAIAILQYSVTGLQHITLITNALWKCEKSTNPARNLRIIQNKKQKQKEKLPKPCVG